MIDYKKYRLIEYVVLLEKGKYVSADDCFLPFKRMKNSNGDYLLELFNKESCLIRTDFEFKEKKYGIISYIRFQQPILYSKTSVRDIIVILDQNGIDEKNNIISVYRKYIEEKIKSEIEREKLVNNLRNVDRREIKITDFI